MFPEASESAGVAAAVGSAVSHFADGQGALEDAVGNLINYQDDSDLATRAVPDLVRLLRDEDVVVVQQSALMVHQLAKKDASRHAILASVDLVATVVKLLGDHSELVRRAQSRAPGAEPLEPGAVAPSVEIVRSLCGTLSNISALRQGLAAIFQAGGVSVLVRQLECVF